MQIRSLKSSILILFICSFFIHQAVSAESFNQNLRDIRSEINRDNLQEAIKKIKKIEIIMKQNRKK